MAPQGWTNSTQLTWLKSKVMHYMEMQAQGKLHKFWPWVYEAWFHDFSEHAALNFPVPNGLGDAPALTSAQMDVLGAAIKTRKEQLQNWFRHQRVKLMRADPVVRRSEASMANVLFGKKKKERRHQPIELFQKAHKSEIRAVLTAAGYDAITMENSTWTDEMNETQMNLLKSQNSERMRLRAKVVQALYSAAPDSERAMLVDKAGAEQVKGVPEATGDEERTPEEYQANINQVCSVLEKVHAAVGTMAGWSGFTVVGGPNPSYGGELSMRVLRGLSICLGVSPAGHDFRKAHPDFEAAITAPFQTFLRGIYPADVRYSRALTSEAPAESSGVDNATSEGGSEAVPEAPAQSTKAKPKRRSKKKKAPAPVTSTALALDAAQDHSVAANDSSTPLEPGTIEEALAVLHAAGLSSFSNSPVDSVKSSGPASARAADDDDNFFGGSVDTSFNSAVPYTFGDDGVAGGSTEQGSDEAGNYLPGWARSFDANLVSSLSRGVDETGYPAGDVGSPETPTKRSSYQPSGLFAVFKSPRTSLSSPLSETSSLPSWPSSATPLGRSSWSDFLGMSTAQLSYPPPPLLLAPPPTAMGFTFPPAVPSTTASIAPDAPTTATTTTPSTAPSTAMTATTTAQPTTASTTAPSTAASTAMATTTTAPPTTASTLTMATTAAAVAAISKGKAAARAQRLGTAGKEIFLTVLKVNTSPPSPPPPPPRPVPRALDRAPATSVGGVPPAIPPSEVTPPSRPEATPPLRSMVNQPPVFGSPSKNKPLRAPLEKQPLQRAEDMGASVQAAVPVLGKRGRGVADEGPAPLGRRIRKKPLDANGEEMQMPVKKTRKERAEEKEKAATTKKAAARGKGRATAYLYILLHFNLVQIIGKKAGR
ncbi:hypothetical protein C8J57DRAFT_1235579 [Mycena rebaudengoi]|nr:hypothetical protein C8J57DRAFT_1235579 [Mycena rebaudengoi]